MWPIRITGADGVVSLDGEAEGTPPAAAPNVVLVAFDFNNPLPAPALVPNTIRGGPGFTGTANATCTGPPTVYPPGVVVPGGTPQVATSGIVPSTADALDLALRVFVTDQTGANVAHCFVTGQVASPVTDTAHLLNLTGGTWTIDTGADLSDGGSGDLVSAAGGIYTTTLVLQVAWD